MPTPRYETSVHEPNWYPDEEVETKKAPRKQADVHEPNWYPDEDEDDEDDEDEEEVIIKQKEPRKKVTKHYDKKYDDDKYDDDKYDDDVYDERELASGTSRVCRSFSRTFTGIWNWIEGLVLSAIHGIQALPQFIMDWKIMILVSIVIIAGGMLIGAFGMQSEETVSLGCKDAFNKFGYDADNMEKYSDFFHSTSNLTVPQLGVYYGPDRIAEYASLFSAASPYLSSAKSVHGDIEFLGNDEDLEVCHFRTLDITEFSLVSAARNDTIYNATSMTRIIYSPNTNKIESVNVHYDAPVLNFFFTELASSDHAREHVCSVMSDICAMTAENCVDKMAALPISDGPYADGNSQACRFVKAAATKVSWDNCAHMSFAGLADSRGDVKCQKSDMLFPHLFDKSDFMAYGEFQKSSGFIPGVGLVENMM
jgi:hypothetical protein